MTRARRYPINFGIAAVILLSLGARAQATHPIILREFKFNPDTSRLGVTGGFAGIDELHGIDGTFGLAIGYDQVFDPLGHIALVPFVSFAAVDAVLTGPPGLLGGPGWLGGADLDTLLNLTGLDGSFVHGPGRPGLLFTGVDGQGQPMKVRVTVQNRQLRLEGGNDAGCCDFFNYRLDASADIPYMGDINQDGHVGIADLNLVLSDFGKAVTPMMGADVDWNGYIGIDDLNAVLGDWNAGSADTAPPVSLLAVPEPIAVGLVLPGLACWILRRRG